MKRGFLVFFIIILIKQSNFTKIEYVKLLIVTFSEDRHILHTGRFGEKYTYTSVFSPLLPLQSITSLIQFHSKQDLLASREKRTV